jgi:2-dehydropantoate 2-reductase
VVGDPAEILFRPDDVVFVTVKSQDTIRALEALAAAASPDVPVFCLQNGVDNERTALRLFATVYSVCVMLPATHLVPGVVEARSAPTTGILDLGRYPTGTDDLAHEVAAALRASTFSSGAIGDVSRWKYRKLITNLGNAVEVVCGPQAFYGPVGKLARREGVACLKAAGIDFASEEEDKARRGDLLTQRPAEDNSQGISSSWQSLTRAVGSVETDYLNGEIVLLGRLFNVPTPVNAALQRDADELARRHQPPGVMSEQEFLDKHKLGLEPA